MSTAWGIGKKILLKCMERYFSPFFRNFYEALTHFLGFKNYGDEYKVMGLAPYGKNSYVSKVQELVNLKMMDYLN